MELILFPRSSRGMKLERGTESFEIKNNTPSMHSVSDILSEREFPHMLSISGCSAVASVHRSGRWGRRFESAQPDISFRHLSSAIRSDYPIKEPLPLEKFTLF